MSLNDGSAELVSVISHLLGFRSGESGDLLDNESATARQHQSVSNIENVTLQNIQGNSPYEPGAASQWEAGALLNTASELGLLKNTAELLQLKRKFEKRKLESESNKPEHQPGAPPIQRPIDKENSHPSSKPNLGTSSYIAPRTVAKPANAEARQDNSDSLNNARGEHCCQPEAGKRPRFDNTPRSQFDVAGSVTSMFNVVKSNSPKFPVREVEAIETNTRNIQHGRVDVPGNNASAFKSAYDQLKINDKAKGIERNIPRSDLANARASGLRRPHNPQPTPRKEEPEKPKFSDNPEVEELMSHESMSNIDPKMVEAILHEVVQSTSTTWEDIAGLQGVKDIIKEVIIWPMKRPDIFNGLRAAPRGILFFGPPGTGKTMFGRVIATQFQSTFFNISASSLTSKWIGDGEKMVRALFAVARLKQPAVIFIDEIDSVLSQRSDTEHESSRRLKTEFLIQFDGCATQSDERILVIGVTNRPQELDEAARRRFVKRIYIPLPDPVGRKQLVRNLLQKYSADLSDEDYQQISELTKGYSGADMTSLCRDASYGPIREIGDRLDSIDPSDVRPMQIKDFVSALRQVKSSVAESDVALYEEWDSKFGCHI